MEEITMKIALGSDHAGFLLKEEIKKHLIQKGYEVIDEGTHSEEPADYPLFGAAAAKDVASGKAQYGVVVCGNGEGICMTANKIKGIRCGIAYSDSTAEDIRAHNNANMISFGGRTMAVNDVLRRLDVFLTTDFLGGRHERRVNEMNDLDK
jgi:ribose 5-phosphate isomerase B